MFLKFVPTVFLGGGGGGGGRGHYLCTFVWLSGVYKSSMLACVVRE